jgi:hypothetical protein
MMKLEADLGAYLLLQDKGYDYESIRNIIKPLSKKDTEWILIKSMLNDIEDKNVI